MCLKVINGEGAFDIGRLTLRNHKLRNIKSMQSNSQVIALLANVELPRVAGEGGFPPTARIPLRSPDRGNPLEAEGGLHEFDKLLGFSPPGTRPVISRPFPALHTVGDGLSLAPAELASSSTAVFLAFPLSGPPRPFTTTSAVILSASSLKSSKGSYEWQVFTQITFSSGRGSLFADDAAVVTRHLARSFGVIVAIFRDWARAIGPKLERNKWSSIMDGAPEREHRALVESSSETRSTHVVERCAR